MVNQASCRFSFCIGIRIGLGLEFDDLAIQHVNLIVREAYDTVHLDLAVQLQRVDILVGEDYLDGATHDLITAVGN
jgi:hypothetical protein